MTAALRIDANGSHWYVPFAQARVLEAMQPLFGWSTARSLGRQLKLSAQVVAGALRHLEDKGLVQREAGASLPRFSGSAGWVTRVVRTPVWNLTNAGRTATVTLEEVSK